jgi:hypothetical protein
MPPVDEPSKDEASEENLQDNDRPYTPPGASPQDKDTDDPNLVDSSEPIHEDSQGRNDLPKPSQDNLTSPEEEGHDREDNSSS